MKFITKQNMYELKFGSDNTLYREIVVLAVRM